MTSRLSEDAVTSHVGDGDPLEVLTSQEAADLLRMDVQWVRRQCKAGRIRATKLGRDWRITRGAIRDLLTGQGAVAGAQGGRSDKKLSARQRRRAT